VGPIQAKTSGMKGDPIVRVVIRTIFTGDQSGEKSTIAITAIKRPGSRLVGDKKKERSEKAACRADRTTEGVKTLKAHS